MPKYETEEDLANEAEIAHIVGESWGKFLKKVSDVKYRVDRAIVNASGEVIGMVEIKDRTSSNLNFKDIDNVFLSLDKFNKGAEFSIKNNLAFYFIVRFPDGIYAYRYTQKEFKVHWVDAMEERRQDPIVKIPTKYFVRIDATN